VTAGTIAIAGATGFTGGLVAATLVGRGAGIRLIGRDTGRLAAAVAALPAGEDVTVRAVPAWDEDGIARALDGCGAVVACAGPFVRAGWPVVRAALAARTHYCDSTGEQVFIRRIFDELDGPARTAGVALVPAAGYDFVPGDLGCALAVERWSGVQALDVTYASESGATSVGTRRSMIEILAAPAVERRDGTLQPMAIGDARKRVATPFGEVDAFSFPGGEAITVARHAEVATVRSFIGARSPPRGLVLLPVVRRLVRVPAIRRFVQQMYARGPDGPDERRRSKRFVCIIDATGATGGTPRLTVEALDPYGFTARSLACLALRMRDGAVTRSGALAPAQAVEPAVFLNELDARVTVQEV
jgi:short subunit dehydrogenase-like uncharacterized protein